ncbi:HAMP domain-containing sensor histidine kinase [Anaerocolumna sp. AGMB13025]|uniref:sensor histidine kinase n=1 Tax=Anaerocolumna sp. AGMB13025 TaxID=3039116 RepID=UPI00241E49B2|nr:HAMP domain-containing sensor histidine kinase [Anaerocolumna sp. AGMB13025]WFR57043.1 HAMP domain-containing sensor histidine kinase [Anaerocolumna sp. AGMB13025]
MSRLRLSIRSKLTLSYIFIVAVVVGLTTLAANMGLKRQFENYVIHRQEKQTAELIDLITMKYQEEKDWNSGYLEIIGMNALQNGMIIVVKDNKKQTVWSAYEHNNGLCQAMIMDMRANMYSYSDKWNGEYVEKTYPIVMDQGQIGTLTTGYVGPYYFNDEELIFIKALNSLFLFTGICSLVIAFALGIYMSVRISRPLKKIATKASSLSEGNYKERLEDETHTREIEVLSDTINGLSDALEQKDKLRKQLTQDVAHELRTPLTSVQGHMEAMIDGIWAMDKDRLNSCYEEIIRIKKLIGSIEELSGVENENVILHKEEFDVSKLIQRLVNNYENDFMQKYLQVNYTKEPVMLLADPDKMSQVLNNLISNAVKYSEAHGSITLEAKKGEEEVLLRIKDTGIGISEADLPNIFERFYRADKSRNRHTGGVGVGLTITKAIIEAHEGDITVSSEYGKGTEVMIKLPQKVS